MSSLLVQSASAENLAKSILSPVLLDHIAGSLSRISLTSLTRLYPDGRCWVWGLTNGSSNRRYWNRLSQGDEVAIIASDGVKCFAWITFKEENPALADLIWGPRADGKLYELVYFSTRPEFVDIPLPEYNEITGYHYDRMPQNAFILDAGRAETLRAVLRTRSLTSAIRAGAYSGQSGPPESTLPTNGAIFAALFNSGEPPALTRILLVGFPCQGQFQRRALMWRRWRKNKNAETKCMNP